MIKVICHENFSNAWDLSCSSKVEAQLFAQELVLIVLNILGDFKVNHIVRPRRTISMMKGVITMAMQ